MTYRMTMGMNSGMLLAAVSLTALAVAASAQDFDLMTQVGPDPVLPEPSLSLVPDLKVAEVVGWADGETPTVAEGLTITALATDLANPRNVKSLPNGDVLVVQSRAPEGKPLERPKDIVRGWVMSLAAGGGGEEPPPSNKITLLRDEDGDGVAEVRSDLLTDLNSPFGVVWVDGTLYVAAADAILAYPYEPGQTEITTAPTVLAPLPGGPINHHWTKDLVASPDGTLLYASVGSNSNVAERGMEAEKNRAAILEVNRETGAWRLFASGLRNPNGLNIHPETGMLWTVVNERDELGPNLVPDYMTSVEDGGFYGWPWSYYGANVDPRIYPRRPDMVERAISPDYALSSHVAALGLAFTNGTAFPEPYANGAFVGQRGSWNRDVFNGYKVVYVPFEKGMPSGLPVDVVTGFLNGDKARGRPVSLGIDGTGALLIADDAGNTVWRVASTSPVAPAESPAVEAAPPTEAEPTVAPAETEPPAEPDAPTETDAPTEPDPGSETPAPLDPPPASP